MNINYVLLSDNLMDPLNDEWIYSFEVLIFRRKINQLSLEV